MNIYCTDVNVVKRDTTNLSDLPHVLEPDMWMCVEEIYGPEGFFS